MALIEALDTNDRDKFERAFVELRKGVSHENLAALLKAGQDKRPRVRLGVVYALDPYGEKPPKDIEPIVNFLLFRLKDDDPDVRAAAGRSH